MENCKEEFITLIDGIHQKLRVLSVYADVQRDVAVFYPIDRSCVLQADEILSALTEIVERQGWDEELIKDIERG